MNKVRLLLQKPERKDWSGGIRQIYDPEIILVPKGREAGPHLVKNKNDLILGQKQITWHLTEEKKKEH